MEIAKKLSEVNNKVDRQGVELNSKFESMSTRMRYVEGILASPSVNNNPCRLPGKAIQNPKKYATSHSITITHDRELPTRYVPTSNTEDSVILEGENFYQDDVLANNPIEEPILTSQPTRPQAPLATPFVEKLEATKTKDTVFVPLPYKPLLPFPGRFKKVLVAKYRALLEKHIKDMPLVDCLALIPDEQKYVKDLITERIKEVQGMVVLSHECNAITQKKIVQEKLEDPGSFTLPCSIRQLTFNNCLCDLGDFVSLMPLSVVKKLGFVQYKPCDLTLILADRTSKRPFGLLEDVLVMINRVEVPTDFVVLEMDEESKDPLILGRPFLASVGAVIDVKQGKINLNLGEDVKMKFDIRDAMKKPTIEGQTFLVEEMDQLGNELLEELVYRDHLQTTLTKSSEAGFLSKIEDVTLNEEGSIDTRLECSTKQLNSSMRESNDWLELKERSKWHDRVIRELTHTVKELKDQVKELHGKANQAPLDIKEVPNDEGPHRSASSPSHEPMENKRRKSARTVHSSTKGRIMSGWRTHECHAPQHVGVAIELNDEEMARPHQEPVMPAEYTQAYMDDYISRTFY
ncbi:hypothetical protein AXX17_AT3G35270 [Arabidopsis thaliana]|uniref:Uncharacterized protein n=1 Tax=Arabidopsis thaliana TaxID=3702 RepID=A0A178VC56_ARATH|nr:hypothetical protein AXX17_AT3G35270 [Arabidopsis thaliana]